MDKGRIFLAGFSLVLLAGVSACGRDEGPQASQTKFPGQVSAGGGTSGEVMARAGNVDNNRDPSGTPGIPQGSGGNTGGAAMGGTSAASGGATGSASTGATASQAGQAPGSGQTASGGTPGVPEGVGGNPSGAEMGGTTSGAAASKTAPDTGAAASHPTPQGKQ